MYLAATAGVLAQRLLGRTPVRELVPSTPGASARWHTHDYPGPFCRWNYHPEYEVHLIQHGTGRFIVGDHIGRFGPGQLVLVGSNLPHHWISDLAPGEHIAERDVVFQFHPDWVSSCRELLPELATIGPLLRRSSRGIVFSGDTAVAAAGELVEIGASAGLKRLRHILAMLDLMADPPADEWRLIANPWLTRPLDNRTADVIDEVLRYVLDRTSDSSLEQAAANVAMSPRPSHATSPGPWGRVSATPFADCDSLRRANCLEQTDLPVATIHHRVGYQNLSNFNRQFLREYNITPSRYRRNHRAG